MLITLTEGGRSKVSVEDWRVRAETVKFAATRAEMMGRPRLPDAWEVEDLEKEGE